MKVKFVICPDTKEVTALFPEEVEGWGFYMCYAHVGQHSSYSLGWAKTQKDATKEEYSDLLKELISIGYDNLEII